MAKKIKGGERSEKRGKGVFDQERKRSGERKREEKKKQKGVMGGLSLVVKPKHKQKEKTELWDFGFLSDFYRIFSSGFLKDLFILLFFFFRVSLSIQKRPTHLLLPLLLLPLLHILQRQLRHKMLITKPPRLQCSPILQIHINLHFYPIFEHRFVLFPPNTMEFTKTFACGDAFDGFGAEEEAENTVLGGKEREREREEKD